MSATMPALGRRGHRPLTAVVPTGRAADLRPSAFSSATSIAPGGRSSWSTTGRRTLARWTSSSLGGLMRNARDGLPGVSAATGDRDAMPLTATETLPSGLPIGSTTRGGTGLERSSLAPQLSRCRDEDLWLWFAAHVGVTWSASLASGGQLLAWRACTTRWCRRSSRGQSHLIDWRCGTSPGKQPIKSIDPTRPPPKPSSRPERVSGTLRPRPSPGQDTSACR